MSDQNPHRWLSRAEADALFGRTKKKRNRYNAQRVQLDGYIFDSKLEAARYTELRLLEQAGTIERLELQPRFPIRIDGRPLVLKSQRFYRAGRPVVYVADFRYVDRATGRTVVEEVKGLDQKHGRLKRALAEHCHGIEVQIIGRAVLPSAARRRRR